MNVCCGYLRVRHIHCVKHVKGGMAGPGPDLPTLLSPVVAPQLVETRIAPLTFS